MIRKLIFVDLYKRVLKDCFEDIFDYFWQCTGYVNKVGLLCRVTVKIIKGCFGVLEQG